MISFESWTPGYRALRLYRRGRLVGQELAPPTSLTKRARERDACDIALVPLEGRHDELFKSDVK